MTNQFILTCSGREHDLNGYDVYQLDNAPSVEEIAHSLAQINRFTGHASRPYSVAEHSLLVANIVKRMGLPPLAQLAALMHDAHECIVGDMASPIKEVIGGGWPTFESVHQKALLARYGIDAAYSHYYALIKKADLIALATERRDLMLYYPDKNRPWPIIDTPGAEVKPDATQQLNTYTRANASWLMWGASFRMQFNELSELAYSSISASMTVELPQSGAA